MKFEISNESFASASKKTPFRLALEELPLKTKCLVATQVKRPTDKNSATKEYQTISGAITAVAKASGKKFTMRAQGDKIRVWRVK